MNSTDTPAAEREKVDNAGKNQEVIADQHTVTSVEDLQKIISKARVAGAKWAELKYNEKTSYLYKVRDYIVKNCDSIVDSITEDNGKVKVDAISADVLPITMAISYYCKNGRKFLKDKKIKAGNVFLINKRSIERKVPYGVIGIISPWNYPFSIPMFEVIIALLSGNSVILKVAKESLSVGEQIKKAFEYAGFPPYVFNYVNMQGRVIGEALIDNGIDKIFFTGSLNVGKSLLKKASQSITPVSLELGGNDAMIVCEDADLDRAASGALWGGFHNSGQSCGGVERIYVQENVYDSFLDKLKSKVESLKVGPASNYESEMGSITTQNQFDIITDHVEDALSNGAKVYASSLLDPDSNNRKFLAAKVLIDVNHSMKIMREETFGPVVCVMKFKEIEEAINLANDSDLGLTASIWTRNKKNALEISKYLQVGVVNINDHLMSHGLAETTWGGMKNSGKNRTHGEQGFIGMTQPQVIVRDALHFLKKDFWWHPYDKKLYDGLKGLIYALYANKITEKVKGLAKVIAVSSRIFKR